MVDEHVLLCKRIEEVDFGSGLGTVLLLVGRIVDVGQIAAIGAPALGVVVIRVVAHQRIVGNSPQFDRVAVSRRKPLNLGAEDPCGTDLKQNDRAEKHSVELHRLVLTRN